MSQSTGLSFEQAPPFSIPLRFFLTAPAFLLAAALVLVFAPDTLSSRFTPQALALTHAVTLGFLAMVMLGALTQMLPVMAGSPMPAPLAVARLTHAPVALGTLALMAGFLNGLPIAFGFALILLGFSLAVFLLAAAVSLARATAGFTVSGIRLAVACLGLTLLLGLALALLRAGWWSPPAIEATASAHLAFGLMGWVLLLVIGVAYQVVPMFQITPPYPPELSRWLAGSLFTLLFAHAIAPLLPASLSLLIDAALAGCILLFAFATLRLQSQRRRKLPDVTLDFWRLGMASLIAGVVVWAAAQFWPAWKASQAYPLLLGVLFLSGFAVSVVNGMLYKIVPFLAWFHLQAQLQAKAGTIPNMKQMIDEGRMRLQFRLHLAACTLLIAAVLQPHFFSVAAGAALAASALLLWINLIAATRRFLRHGGWPGKA